VAGVRWAVFESDCPVRRVLAGLVFLPVILGGLNGLIVILLLFSLWHVSVSLGVRLTLAFFAITTVTSWIFEEIGVATGLVYGPYHYTAIPGPWLGSVPLLIPLAWFMLVYPTYVVANLVGRGWPVGTPGGRGDLVRLALLGALVMTAWDLVVDPILSGPTVGAWVWERGGPYYGVPLQNFLGWIVTTFIVYLLYRSVERRWTLHRAGRSPPVVTAGPGLAHAAVMVWSPVPAQQARSVHRVEGCSPCNLEAARLGPQRANAPGAMPWSQGLGCSTPRAASPGPSRRPTADSLPRSSA